MFAYVKWKTMHPSYDHFGCSALFVLMFEPFGVCSFLPGQRIACRAAHAVMPVDFGHFKVEWIYQKSALAKLMNINEFRLGMNLG